MKALKYWPVYRKFIQWANRNFPVTICKMRFYKIFGRKLNLKNPKDLNEKILWLSLMSDTTEWSRLADKYAVREYVKENSLENILVKLYGKWNRVEDIDWNTLPQSFVIKTNNGAGTVMVVNDKNKLDIDKTKKIINKWLIKDISS